MRVCAWDQSTKCSGWSLFVDGMYQDSGIIDMSKIADTDMRTGEMGIAICNKIEELKPDVVIIENVQAQSGVSVVILLARLQGMIMGYNYAHYIDTRIIAPSQWRKALDFQQGPGVKRSELKRQSIEYAYNAIGSKFPEDQAEACCIGLAVHKIFGFGDVWGE